MRLRNKLLRPVAFFLLTAGVAAAGTFSTAAAGESGGTPGWTPTGLSGGGAMFTPAISPVNPQLFMLNCDMGGAYLSTDSGRTWRLINHLQLRGNTRCRSAFHPKNPKVIFAASGWWGRLKVTRDGGRTWSPLGNLPGGLRGEIAVDPDRPALMLVGVEKAVWRSTDGGKTWRRVKGPHGAAVGFHFDRTSPPARRVCFAATEEGVWRSTDGGATWVDKSRGLPQRGLRGFAGGSNPRTRAVVLYCTVPSRKKGGAFAGGVFRSTDRGETWVSAMGLGINKELKAADRWAMGDLPQYYQVLTTDVKPRTVYVLNTNTGVWPPHHTAVFRSDDAGAHWAATYYPDPRFRRFNSEHDWHTAYLGQFYQERASGAAIAPSDPERVLFCGSMRCAVTEDGGRTWRCANTRPASGALRGLRRAGEKGGPDAPRKTNKTAAWLCNGLVVTSTWHYYVDPFQPRRRYIAYTDIGFARSTDGGKSWLWWGPGKRPPWVNTCYELAFDPATPGKIWGAFSNVHDIPNANIIMGRHRDKGPGGICVSTDFAESWTVSSAGLPKAPALSVVVDAKSPRGRRTLYAAVFGYGVYKSTDDGKSWTKKSRSLGAKENMRVCRVRLHPDGTLFALVTAKRRGKTFLTQGVGLYRSKNGGENWELVNRSRPLLWPKDFTADPRDSRVLYLGACDAGGKKQGGLYRTTDGGATWRLLARKGREHFGAYLHPRRRGWIYLTLCEGPPGAGLWLSRDNGRSWTPFNGLPFASVQRVAFAPRDDATIYVLTFGGGVWRGPAQPRPQPRR